MKSLVVGWGEIQWHTLHYDRQIYWKTDRQIYWQTDRQKYWQTDRYTGRQTDIVKTDILEDRKKECLSVNGAH